MTTAQLHARNASIFTVYNGARALVRAGRLDASRVNKALGLALTRERERISYYNTTADHCTCPDYMYRQGPKAKPCYHMLAAALLTLARQLSAEVAS
jgi:predicted nucleic acid-binding Zn finger protein